MLSIENSDISIMDEDIYFLLYFTASWCGPCKQIYPKLEEYSQKIDQKIVKICKVDINDNEELCERLTIRSVPSFFLYKQKIFIDKCEGSDIEKVKQLLGQIKISE